jgi:hypothetical protein
MICAALQGASRLVLATGRLSLDWPALAGNHVPALSLEIGEIGGINPQRRGARRPRPGAAWTSLSPGRRAVPAASGRWAGGPAGGNRPRDHRCWRHAVFSLNDGLYIVSRQDL